MGLELLHMANTYGCTCGMEVAASARASPADNGAEEEEIDNDDDDAAADGLIVRAVISRFRADVTHEPIAATTGFGHTQNAFELDADPHTTATVEGADATAAACDPALLALGGGRTSLSSGWPRERQLHVHVSELLAGHPLWAEPRFWRAGFTSCLSRQT